LKLRGSVPLRNRSTRSQDRREGPAGEASILFVEQPQSDEVGGLELEGVVVLGGAGLRLDGAAVHPDHLEDFP
jgi:hypothetical protein